MKDINTNCYLALSQFANRLRINAVKMTHHGNSSHVGSVLSIVDILAVLYGHILNVNPQIPNSKDRDSLSQVRVMLSWFFALSEIGFSTNQNF